MGAWAGVSEWVGGWVGVSEWVGVILVCMYGHGRKSIHVPMCVKKCVCMYTTYIRTYVCVDMAKRQVSVYILYMCDLSMYALSVTNVCTYVCVCSRVLSATLMYIDVRICVCAGFYKLPSY